METWINCGPNKSGENHEFRTIGQPRGNTDRGAAGRHVMLDESARADLGEVANADVADDRGSRAEQDSPADPGRLIRTGLPSADGDVLQDSDLVADDGMGTHDDTGGVVEEHTRSDRRGRMNADLKLIGRQALQQQRLIGAAASPEPVGNAPGQKRDISLEVEKRRHKPLRRRIVNGDALEIASRHFDQIGRVRKSLASGAGNLLAIGSASSEPLPDLAGKRAAEIRMSENGSLQRGAEYGIGGRTSSASLRIDRQSCPAVANSL